MKFVKGVMIGTLISAGVVMMYNETMSNNTRKLIKKGKRFIKNMGM